ncbi:MAG: GAF domain-containing protein [Prochlorothrix sp.]|nr:GAF domain-containing protein [Prochlorothrix sp.]
MTQSSYSTGPHSSAQPAIDETLAALQSALHHELETLNESLLYAINSQGLSEANLNLLRGLVSLSQLTVEQAQDAALALNSADPSVEALQQEVEYLQATNALYAKQIGWLRDQEALSRTTTGRLRQKAILHQTLELALALCYAETGSIFLLSSDNVIEDCILKQRNTSDEERKDLVGRVLQKGLAGWVAQNKASALVANAQQDQRWIDLPDQPYRVGAALCVPMVSEGILIGILTLTHSTPSHFTQQDLDTVESCAYQSAVVLHNQRLSQAQKRLAEQAQALENQFRQLLQSPLVGVFVIQSNRFAYVNRKFAALTGYTPDELLQLPSISSVLAYEDRDAVMEAIKTCLVGQSPQLNLTFNLSRKNGTLIKVMAQGVATQIKGRRVVMAMVDAT